jgi:hypothetical protein
MESEAAGTFDVKLAPIGAGDVLISTMSIDKTFHGDLQGTSVGQMLAFRSGIGRISRLRRDGTDHGYTGRPEGFPSRSSIAALWKRARNR